MSSCIESATKLDGREFRYLNAMLNGAGLGGVVADGSCLEIEDEQCWSMKERVERVDASLAGKSRDTMNATIIGMVKTRLSQVLRMLMHVEMLILDNK